MFHMAAFFASQGVTATPVALNGVQDDWLTLATANTYTQDRRTKLYGGYAQGDNITQANINTPIFRPMGPYFVDPIVDGVIPTSLFDPDLTPDNAEEIPKVDPIQFLTTNAGGAAEDQYAFMWLGDGQKDIGAFKIRTVIATSAITVGAKVWGSGTFTFTTGLPAGRYRVVGMDIIGANLLAARLVFSTGFMRPGCLARQTLVQLPSKNFRKGRMGSWGEFESYSPPTLQLFGTAAPTTQTIYLDLQQIRDGA